MNRSGKGGKGEEGKGVEFRGDLGGNGMRGEKAKERYEGRKGEGNGI